MKIIFVLILVWLTSCATGRPITYTGSTPGGPLVKHFLGITPTDSVDFIRWILNLDNTDFTVECEYGISKPNTNGFINGGHRKILSGKYIKSGNVYELIQNNKKLRLWSLNHDLLHMLNEQDNMLHGNAGWSYTLNHTDPTFKEAPIIPKVQSFADDSVVYTGRTPCDVPGINKNDPSCFKLKWEIVFYFFPGKLTGTYKTFNTLWRQNEKAGQWKLVKMPQGNMVYEMYDEAQKPFLFISKLDSNVLIFTRPDGIPLVGDAHFSYTLNRDSFRKKL